MRSWAGPRCPCPSWPAVAEPLVAVHGQADQHRLLQPRAQRDALDAFGGESIAPLLADYRRLHAELLETERELAEVVASARERAREADLLRFGLGEIEAVAPEAGEDASLAEEEQRLGHADTLRTAAESARAALSSDDGGPDALAAVAAARTLLDGVRDHDQAAAALADRVAELTYLLSDLAADVASYASGLETDPGRLAAVSERRAALTALTRKYGETAADVLAWAETSAARLAQLDDTDDRITRLREQRDDLRGASARPRWRSPRPAPRRPPGSPPSSPASSTCSRCPTPCSTWWCDRPRPTTVSRSARGPCGSARRGSTRSSSCSPPTPAASRGRSTRVRRAVSCRG